MTDLLDSNKKTSIKKINQPYNDETINISLDTIKIDKQALVFVNTKRSAEKTAEEIAKKIKAKSQALEEMAERASGELSTPTKQCLRLAKCLKKGIAFHHAGLTSKQKELIEDNFRAGNIKIIACTPTLAAGLDMPAFRTIIRDLKRFGNRGMSYISVLEYLQMAGRAGRPGYEDFGESICIASTEAEKEEIVEKFINGEPEDIYSKLAVEPVLRTYLLSLIATKMVKTKDDILDFFGRTFWAHQFKDMYRLQLTIEKMLDLLEHWEFVRSDTEKKVGGSSSDFVAASDLGKTQEVSESFKATLLGKRVAELYLDPLTAHQIIKGLRKGSAFPEISAFALLQLMCNTLEIRPQLRVKTKDMEMVQERIVRHEDEFLEKEPSIYEPEYDDFLNSIKTAACLDDWINEMSEESILDRFSVRPGELKMKINSCDWLLYAAYELARMQQFKNALKEITKLRIRLKHGAKEELLPLLKFKGIGRVNARRMFFNNVKDVKGVKDTEFSVLAHLIGKARAVSVKEQVGQKVAEHVIKEVQIKKKRKSTKKKEGQFSLNDFC